MNEVFMKIDEDKRERIINSALEEFSKNKFEKASTNTIVKKANISKGLLFHYFGSKKQLYEFLEILVIETIVREVKEKIDWQVSDIFERLKQIMIIKLNVLNRYPYLFPFFTVMFQNKSIDEIIKLSQHYLGDFASQVYHYNIDFSKFKDNMDISKAINIIRWTFEKYGEEFQNKTKLTNGNIDLDIVSKEIDEYIHVLRVAFYK